MEETAERSLVCCSTSFRVSCSRAIVELYPGWFTTATQCIVTHPMLPCRGACALYRNKATNQPTLV